MPKFLCSSSALLRYLKTVAPIIKRNPVLPILENALLSITNNVLTIASSDLGNTITVRLPIEGDVAEWAACPPIKPLLEVLKNLPDQPITVAFDAETSKLTVDASVEGASADEKLHGAMYTFACGKSDDFPETPKVPTGVAVTFPGHLLRTAFGYTAELVSNDELRPAMMCVCVVASREGVDFLATDGHRLCLYQVEAGKEPGYAYEGKNRKMLMLPQQAVKMLKALVKHDDEVTVTTGAEGDDKICFQIGTYGPELVVRPVDERYPDAYSIIPAEFPGGVLTLARPAARTMLNRLLPFCESYTKRIELHFSGTNGQARAENDDISAREPLPGTFAPGGKPGTDNGPLTAIGFNARYLAHLLALLPGPRVRLSFTGPKKGCLLTADGYEGLRYVLMPVAIKEFDK